MWRKDREVTDFQDMLQIIDACDIVRLGIADGAYPYIVPVNFAYQVIENELFLYIHGAKAGRKYTLLRANPICTFEMDIPIKLDCLPEKKDITMRYASVMGKASAIFLEGLEKQQVIDTILMARYEETKDFAYCHASLSRTAVIELKVTEITAKANLPQDESQCVPSTLCTLYKN